jgi:hypothetical protein
MPAASQDWRSQPKAMKHLAGSELNLKIQES